MNFQKFSENSPESQLFKERNQLPLCCKLKSVQRGS